MAGFDTKCMNKYGEYEIRFYTRNKSEYVAVQEFCRNIVAPKIMPKQPLRCDTCKHEKEPFMNRCADCSEFELWEEKEKDRHVCCSCEHATCHFLDPEQCYFDCDIKVDLSEGVTDCYEDNRCSHWKRGKSCWRMKERDQ